MCVTLGLVGVDGAKVDRDLDGGLGRVLVVKLHRSLDLLETSLHRGHHHVAHAEFDGAVSRIQFPGGGRCIGRNPKSTECRKSQKLEHSHGHCLSCFHASCACCAAI